MAIEAGDLVVKLLADLTGLKSGLDEANDRLAKFSAGTIAKGILMSDGIKEMGKTILDFAVSSVEAYAKQETATNKLQVAFKNQGVEVSSATKDAVDYAAALQKVTAFADEDIIASEALLAAFGSTGDQLKKATKAALDLSHGLGIDLHAATLLVAKASEGNTTALSRYGLKISSTIPEGEKFAAVLEKINEKFGGSAQAALDTVAGKVTNLRNRLVDIQEDIGHFLLPVLDFWVKKMGDASDAVKKLTGSEEDGAKGRQLTINSLEEEKAALIASTSVGHGQYQMTRSLTEAEAHRLEMITKSINMEKKKLAEETHGTAVRTKLAHEDTSELDKKTKEMLMKYQGYTKMMMGLDSKMSMDRASLFAARFTQEENNQLMDQVTKLQNAGKYEQAKQLMEQAYRDASQKEEDEELKERLARNKKRAEDFKSTLQFISSLATAKNKELAAIGKAAAIGVATVDTFQAANKALASAPPPWNFGLMAAVVAAGMVNVAKISGVKMAEGGMVLPRDGGTLATIGEAGKKEMVIPLDDPRSKKEIQSLLQDEHSKKPEQPLVLNFNISGQFLEADKAKWQKLLRATIVPEIRRFSEVSPLSSFERRRGQS